VTVGPVVLLGKIEVSERVVDELDVTIVDGIAGTSKLVEVLLKDGDSLFSNVCGPPDMVARVFWKS
jgi:hypothetical protein